MKQKNAKLPAYLRKEPQTPREVLHQFVTGFCKRPQMYFRTCSFSEAEAMLWGWHQGAKIGESNSTTEYDLFMEWAIRRYHFPGAEGLFGWIRRQYADEPARFRRLLFLFNKYIRETGKASFAPPDEQID